MINNGQILTDQDIWLQEMMGTRPARQMIVIKKGATVQDIARAFMTAEMSMDNQGLTRYSKTVVVGPKDRSGANEMDLDKIDLTNVPPGFDRADNQAKGMFVIALALGVPARWLWPATTTGATKADALYQHVVGLVTGPAEVLMVITHGLETLFLPPTLQISTDYQDDEQDRAAAEIASVRSQTRKQDLESKVITIRVAREQMLSDGEITEAQFIGMELDEGRLRDGSDVLAVFSSTDPEMQRLVDLGTEEPLAVDAHNAIEMLLAIEAAAIAATDLAASGRTPSIRLKAKQAVAGLGKLKGMYSKKAAAQAQQDLGLMQAASPVGAEPMGGQPEGGPGPGVAGGAKGGKGQGIPPPSLSVSAPKPGQSGQSGQSGVQRGAVSATQGQGGKGFPGLQVFESLRGAISRLYERVKGYDFGVGAGEVIGGGLARDLEGEFVSADELRAKIEGEMLNRLASARLSDEERAANRAKIAKGLGIDPAALTALDSGDYGGHEDTLVERGLLWRDERTGNLSKTFRGTTLLNAANRGDEAGAGLVMKSPEAQPGKGGGGAAAKPSREEVERGNRKEVSEKLAGDMEAGDLEALHSFQQGEEIDGKRAARLAEDGLIEYDQDGEPRMARAGRRIVKAANAGEAGEARDLLSQSREEVQAKVERAAEIREQVSLLEVQLSKIEGTEQIKDIVQAGRLKAAIRKARRQADRIERALGKLKEQAEEAEQDEKEQD
jgi:hypothetical protein